MKLPKETLDLIESHIKDATDLATILEWLQIPGWQPYLHYAKAGGTLEFSEWKNQIKETWEDSFAELKKMKITAPPDWNEYDAYLLAGGKLEIEEWRNLPKPAAE